MDSSDEVLSAVRASRQQFMTLVNEVRPELHRYCARMVGSIADGEDIVQDTLARGYYELAELRELPALRPWLFRIAHNRALDHLRRYERRNVTSLEMAMDIPADPAAQPEQASAREEAVRLSISHFLEIAAVQRSCVILKDVLEYSLEEIATMLELSVPAVKAALHRGRSRLRELSAPPQHRRPAHEVSATVARYAALFNARDWEGVRALLVDEVRLDLVSRDKRTGRQNVGHYFTNYAAIQAWHVVPGWLDEREVLAIYTSATETRPTYFIELSVSAGKVIEIRDFRYVPYIGLEAAFEPAATV